jgi:hypothetical protein
MAVPNIFGTATSAIPLSQLDQNFATAITLGNTAVYLGNTTTSLGNVTLTNVTISSGTSNIAANVSTAVGLLPQANGGTGTTTGYYGFKNRIINGAMVIDQRNAGASVTNAVGGNVYAVDRFDMFGSQASKFTAQQNAASVTPPAGFKTYLGITSSSAYTVGASESFSVRQRIEGFNTADLDFGSASASTITFSFWVRSSLTGAFGGCFYNANGDRFYPFTYSISSANTWEQKTVTVAGDTTGTWAGATNGIGLVAQFSLGAGASVSGTAGAWTGSAALQPTGSTSVVGTNGATWYITGVQLEKGSTATSFDYRPFGTELALCQRYFCSSFPSTVAPAQNTGTAYNNMPLVNATIAQYLASQFFFPVAMRSVPTITLYNPSAANAQARNYSTGTDCSSTSAASGNNNSFYIVATPPASSGAGHTIGVNWSASIEL